MNIEIYAMTGQLVFTDQLDFSFENLSHINANRFVPGVYILKIKAENIQGVYDSIIAEKFMFEKKRIVNELKKYGIQSLLTRPGDLTRNSNATILISSHDLGHVTEVCERIVVLEKGEIVKDIKTSEETLKELETYFSV